MTNINHAFALNFYNALKATEGNLLFSPYSILTVFAMTYSGARGETAQQMAKVFGFSPGEKFQAAFSNLEKQLKQQNNDDVLLLSANSLYPQIQYPFLDSFLSLLRQYYNVQITGVDYQNNVQAAQNTINQWVAEQTQNKITELIPADALNELTRLILVNAVYFKGKWASPFEKELTTTKTFWVTSEHQIKVPMMQQAGKFSYAKHEDIQVLELPYGIGNFSLMILLPRTRNGLAELEKNLSLQTLYQWVQPLYPQQVEVCLPRFQVNFKSELSHTLTEMGITDAFNEHKANFSGMDGQQKWLYIQKVFHQAGIEVNEEGSEATAASAVQMEARSIPPSFIANHPFIFLITENQTGTILFMGRFVNPENRE